MVIKAEHGAGGGIQAEGGIEVGREIPVKEINGLDQLRSDFCTGVTFWKSEIPQSFFDLGVGKKHSTVIPPDFKCRDQEFSFAGPGGKQLVDYP